jgi:hypothetical protein
MAKDDKKKSKKHKADKDAPLEPAGEPRGGAQDAVEAVRAAVERTLGGVNAEDAARRTRGLVDDVASAALRLRQNFEQARLQEEVRALRAEIASLTRRVAALEEAARSQSHGSV